MFGLNSKFIEEDAQSRPASVPDPEWYAIQTKYRLEKQVTAQLQQKGLKTFLPAVREMHCWSDRQKKVEVPLFPGYTFARFDLDSGSKLEVLRTHGVIGLVTFGREQVPIPPKQVDDLQRLLTTKIPCALRAFLKVGQKVRIRGGSLDGLEGILEQDKGTCLSISIEAVRRSVVIKIDGYDVEFV